MLEDQNLCVAYAADDNYAKYLGISMLSLYQSNKGFEQISVFVLDCEIGENNKERLRTITRQYQREITFLPMKSMVSHLDLHFGSYKISIASYARLFLSSIIQESVHKILYLDCDTIVCDSLTDLWDINLEGKAVAGVLDTVDSFFLKKIGLPEGDPYVNAGIILVNLAYWREHHMEQQFMAFIRKFEGNVPHHDQGTINGTCRNAKLIIAPRYNVTSNLYSFSSKTIRRMYFMDTFYAQEELNEARIHPAIVHFTTGLVGRPWEENCIHPMKNAYLQAAKASPWIADPLLPDSRGFLVKAFSYFYYHAPHFLTEAAYRSVCRLAHIRK